MNIWAIATFTAIYYLMLPLGSIFISPQAARAATVDPERQKAAGKSEQCEQLIAVANQAVNGVEAITRNTQPTNENLLRVADIAETAAEDMAALQLFDPQLRSFQSQFIQMYQGTSSTTRQFVAALEVDDDSAAHAAHQRLEAATSVEEPLVANVNRYCGAGS
jgi:hypothetical protein